MPTGWQSHPTTRKRENSRFVHQDPPTAAGKLFEVNEEYDLSRDNYSVKQAWTSVLGSSSWHVYAW